MSTPLVSITSAFYNPGAGLLDMVRSVFAQTFTDWELILVDDGSTDNSLQVAKSIDDPRIRVFTNGRNLGRSVSLNKITTVARGKYIARMDADDMSGLTRIQKQVELIESEPEVDVVGSGICYLDKDDSPTGHWHAPLSHEEICRQPSRTFRICHGSILGKRSWFEKHRYDESIPFAVDFKFFLDSYEQSKFDNVPEPLYYYRLDQSFNLKKQLTARWISANFLFEYHKQAGRWGQALTNWAIQYGKFATTMLMFTSGLRKRLMARRFKSLADMDMAFYTQEIRKIKSIELPIRR